MPLNGERNVILLMIAAQLQDVSFRNFVLLFVIVYSCKRKSMKRA